MLKIPVEIKSQKSFIKTKNSEYAVGNVVDCSKKINGRPMFPGLVVATMDGPVRIGQSGQIENYQVKPTSVLSAKQEACISANSLVAKVQQQPTTSGSNVENQRQEEPSTDGMDTKENSLFISLSESALRLFAAYPLYEDKNEDETIFDEYKEAITPSAKRKGIFKTLKSWMRKKICRLNCFNTTSETDTINQ
eukprot:TCONS_00027498-protein